MRWRGGVPYSLLPTSISKSQLPTSNSLFPTPYSLFTIRSLLRLLGTLFGAAGSTRSRAFGLVPGLLCAPLGGVVSLLRSVLHAISRVLRRVFGLVTCVAHILFRLRAVVLRLRGRRIGLLTPSGSRYAHQSRPEKHCRYMLLHRHAGERFMHGAGSWFIAGFTINSGSVEGGATSQRFAAQA